MKKAIAFLLLFALTLSFCGCEKENVRGRYENSKPVDSDVSKDTAATDKGEFSDAADLSVENTVPDDTSSTSKDFSMGNIAGNVYVNDFIGIRFKLDSGWTFYDDDKIKELNQLAMDLAGDEVEEILKNASVVYDMYATDGDQLNNVIVNLEKASALQLVTLDIAENYKALIPLLKESFKNMGYENINCEIIKVTVDGKTLDALHTSAEINGVKMYQTLTQTKCTGYLACMSVTTYFEDTTSDLLNNFEWIE